MRKQYQTILQTAKNKEKLVPAFEVKKVRAFPTEYRKRCSELVKLGWLKNEGLVTINGHCFGSFSVTKIGEKIIKK